jgi:hypothetical protein
LNQGCASHALGRSSPKASGTGNSQVDQRVRPILEGAASAGPGPSDWARTAASPARSILKRRAGGPRCR